MSKKETIDRLIQQALRSFAELGYSGASLRTMVSEAGLPLATVHNYFASKEALYLAVIEHCLLQINRERLERLQAARTPGPLALIDVVSAIVDPVAQRWISPADENRYFVLLIRQLGGSPRNLLPQIQNRYLDDTARQFADALREVCPRLDAEQAVHHYAFLVSSTYHALAQHERLAYMADASSDDAHLARLVDDLKAFAVRGIG